MDYSLKSKIAFVAYFHSKVCLLISLSLIFIRILFANQFPNFYHRYHLTILLKIYYFFIETIRLIYRAFYEFISLNFKNFELSHLYVFHPAISP